MTSFVSLRFETLTLMPFLLLMTSDGTMDMAIVSIFMALKKVCVGRPVFGHGTFALRTL